MFGPQTNDLKEQEEGQNQKSLLPSGYQSPKLNLTSRLRVYMSQYERQIIRSLLSSNIQKIPLENSNTYLVNYDSEVSIFKIQGDQIKRSLQPSTFASFVKIYSNTMLPKRIKSYLIDRNNIIYQYEIDYMKGEIPSFRNYKHEINTALSLESYIFLSCIVSQDGFLLVMVSDTKIFFLNLRDGVYHEIKNPLNINQFPLEFNFDKKVHLELDPTKTCFIMAHESTVVIYNNFDKIKQFELKKQQTILNIKLFGNQLIILTNLAIIKIDNVFNKYIQLKEEDYFYLQNFEQQENQESYINYGTFEIENQEIKSVIIYDSNKKFYLIEMQSIQQGQLIIKELKTQFDEDEKIEMIEVERITLQSIVLRIFYFKKNHELGYFEYQGSL
ncbi:unnamed protein product (macronuclear) [Paramecium tetraurelia]|uniref:Uncharacterized protein n=1 Tax=Paramecium tetraurelia TaxID=5888 RepID=A0DIK1_PARTE|nr:uncharacterized protein GSPATT00017225001 [Paramecium tetraurelia]CAK82868.1 unnamed protein product [Paramecium tetraurelia]|eukprot:XP_001450265.1 hypothetical protein (macronuclear) [Paramecium tetraurelia strain d4-2]